MSDAPRSDDPRRATRLRLLMFALAIIPPAAILFIVALALARLASELPNDQYVNPVVAVALYLLTFIVIGGLFVLAAILAAWILLKRFTRAEVRSEFLWAMWLPKTSSFNGRLFDKLFPPKPPNSR